MRLTWKLGFTVVEVFMVITLLAVVAALMVVPVQRLLDAMHYRPAEELLLSAVRKAHMQARQSNHMVILDYLSKSNLLRLCSVDGACLEEFSLDVPDREEGAEPVLQFHRLEPEDPKGDSLAFEQEEDAVESIVFLPTGPSTPFAVELMGEGKTVRLVLDPFSSEPVLREVEGAGL